MIHFIYYRAAANARDQKEYMKQSINPSTRKYLVIAVIVFSILGFAAWAGFFVYRNSVVAVDGNRYYALFDDAMISMRYAWNLANGNGLVWNPGERVEGYTNLLMTLLMAVVIKIAHDRVVSVLVMHIIGMAISVGIAFTVRRFYCSVLREDANRNWWESILVFLAVLTYFPLHFWSVAGMETGLLTLLLTLSFLFFLKSEKTEKQTDAMIAAGFFGAAFLTRNDAMIYMMPMAVTMLYRLVKNFHVPKLKTYVMFFLILGVFVFIQEIIRITYYGNLMPNTYTLKVTGLPIDIRLQNGWMFILHYLKANWHWLIIFIFSIGFNWKNSVIKMIGGAFFIAIFYQVWVGGDPWTLGRMMAPMTPLAFAVIVYTLSTIAAMIRLDRQKTMSASFHQITVCLLVLLLVFSINWKYKDSVLARTPYNLYMREQINTAIALRAVTEPSATIGVFWAGVLPYYSDLRAIDFLGKSDPVIALTDPVVADTPDEIGMNSIPGHNKYDLEYSIITLKPTYIEEYRWGKTDIVAWVQDHYVHATRGYTIYNGQSQERVNIKLFLLKDSPDVEWNEIDDVFPIE